MQDNDEIRVVRRWISNQRVDTANQIAALQLKLRTFDQLEKELNKTASSKPIRRVTLHRPRGGRVEQAAILALEAAGTKGLSGRELADVAQLPIGSATARLSIMKKEGTARHEGNRYFVVHSKQEDNNVR